MPAIERGPEMGAFASWRVTVLVFMPPVCVASTVVARPPRVNRLVTSRETRSAGLPPASRLAVVMGEANRGRRHVDRAEDDRQAEAARTDRPRVEDGEL